VDDSACDRRVECRDASAGASSDRGVLWATVRERGCAVSWSVCLLCCAALDQEEPKNPHASSFYGMAIGFTVCSGESRLRPSLSRPADRTLCCLSQVCTAPAAPARALAVCSTPPLVVGCV
jgi:hypothetical protein